MKVKTVSNQTINTIKNIMLTNHIIACQIKIME